MSEGKGNLLIIDDEEILLDRMEILLEDYADRVFTAINGKEGFDILEREEIHCIVCDINMPVMNGIELIKKVRKNNIDIPFIFYTGHGNREMMKDVIKYGAFDFLNKPELEGLEEVVQRGLSVSLNKEREDTDYESEYLDLLKKS